MTNDVSLSKDAVASVEALSTRLVTAVNRTIVGRETAIHHALIALLAQGHLLIEDVPGTGKTTLARALANALGCTFRRIQFTPDLVPGDVLGVNIYNAKDASFEFRPGPIFANIVLADEINRATPRTQSALLEAMQEAQASIDGETRALPQPFLVLATQNPIEMEGTFQLPEAQLDRFLIRTQMGYPTDAEEDAMLARFESAATTDWPAAETSADELLEAQSNVLRVEVRTAVREYIRRLVASTRTHSDLRLGASPRASLALQRASQALAAISGRSFVMPDDVKALAVPTLAHRVVIDTAASLRGVDGAQIVEQLTHEIEVPTDGTRAGPA